LVDVGTSSRNVKEVEISYLHVDTGEIKKINDFVAVEEPFHILVNDEYYATILCTPSNVTELVVGHLVSEGIVNSLSEIRETKTRKDREFYVNLVDGIDAHNRLSSSTSYRRLILSACGSPENWSFSGLIDDIPARKLEVKEYFNATLISDACRQLNIQAITYRQTGGLHAAAIYSPDGNMISFAEDVGRHNAVDKVIGLALLHSINLENSLLVCTGRLSGDMVLKGARVGILIIASISPPLISGIEIAKKTGITLIGFVRGQRMNIYSYPERISVNKRV